MTDKALEAALLPCPFCGGDAVVANVLTFVGVECGECGSDIGCNPSSYPQDQRGPETWITEAIAAWNRRAPVSALPGEAEVVAWRVPAWNTTYGQTGWQFLHRPDAGRELDADERAKFEGDMAEATPLVTLASLQALQARAEKAERERDEAEEAENETKDCFWAIYPRYLEMGGDPISTEVARTNLANRAEAAEARVKEMEAKIALIEEEVEKDNSCLGRSDSLALRNIRTALKGGSNG